MRRISAQGLTLSLLGLVSTFVANALIPTLKVELNATGDYYYISNLAIGGDNQTVRLQPTFYEEDIAVISPDCEQCKNRTFNVKSSADLGYFEYTSDDIRTLITWPEDTSVARYLEGRYAEDTVNIREILQQTFNKTAKTELIMI